MKDKNDRLPLEGKAKAASVTSAANESREHSLIIVALSRGFGLAGLVSPVTESSTGEDLRIDFYHPESGTLIKVLRSFEPAEIDKWKSHPLRERMLFIVDARTVGAVCDGCGIHVKSPAANEVLEVMLELSAYLYANGLLLEPSDDYGQIIWKAVLGGVWLDMERLAGLALRSSDETEPDGGESEAR